MQFHFHNAQLVSLLDYLVRCSKFFMQYCIFVWDKIKTFLNSDDWQQIKAMVYAQLITGKILYSLQTVCK